MLQFVENPLRRCKLCFGEFADIQRREILQIRSRKNPSRSLLFAAMHPMAQEPQAGITPQRPSILMHRVLENDAWDQVDSDGILFCEHDGQGIRV